MAIISPISIGDSQHLPLAATRSIHSLEGGRSTNDHHAKNIFNGSRTQEFAYEEYTILKSFINHMVFRSMFSKEFELSCEDKAAVLAVQDRVQMNLVP